MTAIVVSNEQNPPDRILLTDRLQRCADALFGRSFPKDECTPPKNCIESDCLLGNRDQLFVDFHGAIVRPHPLGVLERLRPRCVKEAKNEWLIAVVFCERLF